MATTHWIQVSVSELADDVAIVFPSEATEEFEGYHEANYTDTGAGEHAAGGDAPCRGNEA